MCSSAYHILMSKTEPSWELYGAFLAVMQTGSLSGAARSLGVAQPTVRRQIESLEEQLGVVLFTRAPNGLVPTELARATLPYAESLAASAKALVRSVSGGRDTNVGSVRISASEVVGVEVLPHALASLREAHPRLQLELGVTNRLEDLLRRDADVAVRMTEPTQAGLVRKRAARIELGLYAAESYLARHRAPRSIRELAGSHVLVGPDRARAQLEAFAAAGLPTHARSFALRTDSDLAQLAAVRAGIGVGVCQVPLHGALVRVLPQLTFHLEAWVVMHEDLRQVRRVRTVFDHLVEELRLYVREGVVES
jgi:DNA-binding transcriptional LysR family regulator